MSKYFVWEVDFDGTPQWVVYRQGEPEPDGVSICHVVQRCATLAEAEALALHLNRRG